MTYEEALETKLRMCDICRNEAKPTKAACENCSDKVAIDAISKQIPKRPDRSKNYGFCKCPEGHNIPKVCESGRMRYCPFCGQHILWEDEET